MTAGRSRFVTAGVALVAVLVRLPGVYTQSFWEDEVASARILQEPTLGGVLRHVARTESTPPLWYVLAWSVHQAGVPMRDLRLLSVLAGALLAAGVVVLARRFVSLPAAAFAGLAVALGAEFVAHGQELRAYELFALLTLALALAVLREVEAPSRVREITLAAAVAAGGLTHFFFAFSAVAALGWLLVDPGARPVRRRAAAAMIAGGALALAWTPVMVSQYHQDRFWWIKGFSLRVAAAVPLRLFTYAYSGTALGAALSLATLAVVVVGGVRLARRFPGGRLVAVLVLAPLVEAGAVWAAGMRIFALRNLIGVGPFVALAVAGAVDALPRRRIAPALAFALAGTVAVSLAVSEVGEIPPYNVMARALVAEGWHPAVPIAVFGDPYRYRGPLEWYLPRQPVLDFTRPLRRVCREVLVVTRRGRVEALRLHVPPERDPALRGATILGDAARLPQCVHVVRKPRAALA